MPALPDIAAQYLQGVHIGAAIAQERQRIKAENVRTAAEAAARAETNQREYLQEQARLQTEQAYKQSVLSLQQQKLADAEKVNQQRVQSAATRMQHQHGFDESIAAGVPVMDALARFPLASAGPAIAEQKETREAAGASTREKRLQEHEMAMESIAKSGLTLRQQAEARQEGKPVRTGETVVTDAEDPNKRTTTYQFGQPSATPIPPSTVKAAPDIKPLPQRKEDLEKGAQYQTHKGVRTWNGNSFVLPSQ